MFNKHLRGGSVKIIGERGSTFDLARGRLVMVSAFFALLFMLVAAKAIDLSVVQGRGEQVGHFQDQPTNNIRRGDVFDREGTLLATTLETASLYADPKLITDAAAVAKKLSTILPGESYGALLKRMQSNGRFVWLKRNLTPDEQFKVLELGEPGLEFQNEYKRIYPQGALTAHMLGYTSIDNRGLAGVERSFNEVLTIGQDLNLTLDIRLQHVLRREVMNAISQFSAKAGAGVIMDVTNGDVLAGVSLPDFEPLKAGEATDFEKFNRLGLGVYELGSLFKIFSTAAVLDIQNLAMNARFDAREPIKIGRFTINDFHAEGRILTLPEVFMYSSNIGAAKMGEMIGTESLRDFYDDLGLLTKLDWDISEAGTPLVPDPWGEVHTLTASYGHGLATTPLQMTAAVATIVNGGYLVKPRLVKLPADSGVIYPENNKTIRIVSEKTSHRIRQLMRLVVTDGTGAKADVPGYRVGGKTGTAEKSGTKGYDRSRLLSSFVAMFPAEAPRYVVMVMVDEPKGNKKSYGYATAGWVAAPAVANVISAMGSILGIPAEPRAPDQELGASLKQYVMSNEDRESLKRDKEVARHASY